MFSKKYKLFFSLVAILLYLNMGFAQFNTVKKSSLKGTVSMIDINDLNKKEDSIIVRDSIKVLLKEKKVEYNMGILPLDSVMVTSPYGMRFHPIRERYLMHNGIDLRARGKRILAVQVGYISDTGYDSSLGQYVKLKCGSFEFIYGHLKHIYVKLGQLVQMGDILGATGGTGKVTAEHLHFAIKNNGEYIDPYPILSLIYENLYVDSITASE